MFAMSSSNVLCTIKDGQDGVNIVKSVEIRPDGERGYLSNLSTQLRQLQSDVNASLSELVDKEKSRATKGGHRRGVSGVWHTTAELGRFSMCGLVIPLLVIEYRDFIRTVLLIVA